jgi:uncharacterized protein (UPF0212 family)
MKCPHCGKHLTDLLVVSNYYQGIELVDGKLTTYYYDVGDCYGDITDYQCPECFMSVYDILLSSEAKPVSCV